MEDNLYPRPDSSSAVTPLRRPGLLPAAVIALGAVYGSLGTSPLYTIKTCFHGSHGVPLTGGNVLGIVSLIFWSLLLVVGLKYLVFILRADNQGRGGIIALLALVARPEAPNSPPRRAWLLLLGLFAAALLYGDALIMPVISVYSATEGLELISARYHGLVVPLTAGILIGLFLIQWRGAVWLGAAIGPIMLVWFAGIAALGGPWISRHPEILHAVNPYHAIRFLTEDKSHGFRALGGVVLCVTGAEAIYAGLGALDRRSIRLAFMVVVMPALVISYFAQGAWLLERPDDTRNPFFQLAPSWALYPVVVGATVAATFASQSLIWGAFSLTRQAVQLSYWPRVRLVALGGCIPGQVFVPAVNTVLLFGCVALVIAFRHERSAGLAAAFGVAVTGAMAITGLLFGAVARKQWGWSWLRVGPLVALFLIIDLTFLASSLAKVREVGWIPLVIAGTVFVMMTSWKRGREALAKYISLSSLPLELLISDLARRTLHRPPGTAVFLSNTPDEVPNIVLHQVKHNKCLHQQVVILSILTEPVPEVPDSEIVTVRELGSGCFQVSARYGFMQSPNVPAVLHLCHEAGLPIQGNDASFYLGHDTILSTGHSGLARWRKQLFSLLSRNANSAADYFGLPPNRVVELGAQIQI